MACTIQKVFLLLAAIILLAVPAIAEENVTELKIESITTPIKAGERLDFSFSAGNMSGPECSAQIEYWFGNESEKSIQGNDNFYLRPGQTITQNISLLMPSSLDGVKALYLEMRCNDSTILASRIVEIASIFPAMPRFESLSIEKSEEETQLEFTYNLWSSREEAIPIQVEEKIESDGNVLWTNSESIAVAGSTEIKRLGPKLPPGSYRLVAEASYGSETAKIVREFNVKAAAPSLIPMLSILGLALLMFAAAFLTIRQLPGIMKYYRRQAAKAAPTAEKASLEESEKGKQRIRLFEAESSGLAPEHEISSIADKLGLMGKARATAIQFAGKTEVQQNIKSCIVVGKTGKPKFETTVLVSLANNTNRNWTKVEAAVKIPNFLGKRIKCASEDTKVSLKKTGKIAKFTLEKVGAMQTVSFSYNVPALISQAEANSVPLPAVLSYEEGEPLIITQVKVEKPQEEKVKQFYSEIEAGEEKEKLKQFCAKIEAEDKTKKRKKARKKPQKKGKGQ